VGCPEFLYEKKGHIAIMTWNRPEKRNCFTPAMIDAFYEAFDDFNEDPELYVAILDPSAAISFGYEDPDHPANGFRTTRAAIEDFTDWRGA